MGAYRLGRILVRASIRVDVALSPSHRGRVPPVAHQRPPEFVAFVLGTCAFAIAVPRQIDVSIDFHCLVVEDATSLGASGVAGAIGA
jgi:hypothetical protein